MNYQDLVQKIPDIARFGEEMLNSILDLSNMTCPKDNVQFENFRFISKFHSTNTSELIVVSATFHLKYKVTRWCDGQVKTEIMTANHPFLEKVNIEDLELNSPELMRYLDKTGQYVYLKSMTANYPAGDIEITEFEHVTYQVKL